jgi:hypothetical protein
MVSFIFIDCKAVNIVQKDLSSFKNWIEVEPETITWKYVFTNNEYCIFAGNLEYLKKYYYDGAIQCGKYYVDGNKILLDNKNKSKADFVYKGNNELKYTDQAGNKYKKVVNHFVKNNKYKVPAYYGTEKSNAKQNKIFIKKLKKLIK